MRFVLILLGFTLVIAAASGQERADRAGSGLLSLDGKPADLLGAQPATRAKLVVFVFTRTDCPISNVYAPEVRSLHAEFAPRGVEFWLIYGGDESPEVIRKHLVEYKYPFGALRDPGNSFARQSRARVTPEAAVYGREGELLFHGRIDDRYTTLTERRPAPTVRDLHAALSDLLAGKPAKAPAAPAVGCLIEGGK